MYKNCWVIDGPIRCVYFSGTALVIAGIQIGPMPDKNSGILEVSPFGEAVQGRYEQPIGIVGIYSPLPFSPTNHCSLLRNSTLKVVKDP